ncbi:hypothetical protein, partial [Pseudomonas sp. NFACC45]|uniref:hypothetical protein n=1 Tax=Pseudomonas sp. NFACC45 TaxID=1566201 RepID=UPI001C434E6C
LPVRLDHITPKQFADPIHKGHQIAVCEDAMNRKFAQHTNLSHTHSLERDRKARTGYRIS